MNDFLPTGKIILYAEDHEETRVVLSGWLRDRGFIVVDVEDGLAAIQALFTTMPDLILTDWMMPNMSGIELVKHLRARPAYDQIPIAMLSSMPRPKPKHLKGIGIDLFLHKPTQFEDLFSDIQLLLSDT